MSFCEPSSEATRHVCTGGDAQKLPQGFVMHHAAAVGPATAFISHNKPSYLTNTQKKPNLEMRRFAQ
jgi:hypothetical protein